MRRILTTAMMAAAMTTVGPTGAFAETSPGNAPSEPLRLIETGDKTITMTQSEPATARPDSSRDVWIWVFSRDAIPTGDILTMDTTATRYKVDCEAGTYLATGMRSYLFGRLVHESDMTDKPQKRESSTARLSLRIACEPGFKADARRFPDYKVARTAATKLFAGNTEQTPPSEATKKTAASASFRIIRSYNDMVIMAEGTRPVVRPDEPVELRWWTFLAEPIVDNGEALADTMMVTYRVDCAANTLQRLKMETYVNGRATDVDTKETAPNAADAVSDRLVTGAACDPDFEPNARILQNLDAAQTYVLDRFGKKASKTTPQATPSKKAGEKISEALAVPGPYRILTSSKSMFRMLVGPPPESRPEQPVERWLWTFMKEPRGSGDDAFDKSATLIRVDCTAQTMQGLKWEQFLAGRLMKTTPMSVAPSLQDKEGTVGYVVVQATCTPGYGKKPDYLTDHAAASRVVAEVFGQSKTPAKQDGDQSAPRQDEQRPALLIGSDRKIGPIRMTGPDPTSDSDNIYMTEGLAPKTRPNQPVDIWEWTFLAKPMTASGKNDGDTMARLQRVDCDARTRQTLAVEFYAQGKLVHTADYVKRPPNNPALAAPQQAPSWLVEASCSPNYKPDARVYPGRLSAHGAASLLRLESKIKTLSSSVQADIAVGAASAAGEAVKAGGPLRVIGQSSTTRTFFMGVGEAPKTRPTKPVELWLWSFSQSPRRMDNQPPYDTWATRMRIDCRTGMVRSQLREGYRDGSLDNSWELTDKPRKAAKGSLEAAALSAACDPAFKRDSQRFKDHRAARAAASNTTFRREAMDR